MILALAILAAFAVGVVVGACWTAPNGHETRDGLFIDRADIEAQRGADVADSLSRK